MRHPVTFPMGAPIPVGRAKPGFMRAIIPSLCAWASLRPRLYPPHGRGFFCPQRSALKARDGPRFAINPELQRREEGIYPPTCGIARPWETQLSKPSDSQLNTQAGDAAQRRRRSLLLCHSNLNAENHTL
jgi:hypothetical protein